MKRIISTPTAPKAVGAYSQAVRLNNFLFVSGQIPLNPETNRMIQGDITTQIRQVMDNIGNILAAAGMGFEHIVKSTIFLSKMSDFATVNTVYEGYFADDPPARECVAVVELPKSAGVEVSVIACLQSEESLPDSIRTSS